MTSSSSTRYCPSCGTPCFDAGQYFCQTCGAAFTTPTSTAGASGPTRQPGLDSTVNQYIQDRVRDSSAIIAQQVKQELASQVRRTAETQLRRNGGKIALYAAVGVAGIIVVSAIVSLITGLLIHLLPFALIILIAYIGYLYVRGRLHHV